MTQAINVQHDFTEEEVAVFKPMTAQHQVVAPEAAISEDDFTEEEAQDVHNSLEAIVVAQYKQGVSVTEIIKSNDLSSGKVYEILAHRGVELRNKKYKTNASSRFAQMTQMEKQSVIAEYKAGLPLAALYEKFNMNKNGIYKVLDEAKTPRRNNHTSTEATRKETVSAAPVKEDEKEAHDAKVDSAPAAQPQAEPVYQFVSNTLHITISKKQVQDSGVLNISVELTE